MLRRITRIASSCAWISSRCADAESLPAAVLILAVTASSSALASPVPAASEGGESIYKVTCARCHDSGNHAPGVNILKQLPSARILDALTNGAMKPMAATLSDDQRRLVAAYLGRSEEKDGQSTKQWLCPQQKEWFDYSQPIKSNGFGISGPENRRVVSADHAPLTDRGVKQLELQWAFRLLSPTTPALAGGAIFLGGLEGRIHALDARSGCIRWSFDTGVAIRSGVVIGSWDGTAQRAPAMAPLLYFGDRAGYTYALNAATGQQVWKVKAHDHPYASIIATPILFQNRVFVGFSSQEGDFGPSADPNYSCCTFRGLVAALDAQSGRLLWQAYNIQEPLRPQWKNSAGVQQFGPSGAAVLGGVTVDARRGVIYSASDNNYTDPRDEGSNAVFSRQLATGELLWRRQMTPGNPHNGGCSTMERINCPKAYREENHTDYGFKAPPVLAHTSQGTEILIAPQKNGRIWGLDPDTGKTRWESALTSAKVNYGVHQGVAISDDLIYATTVEMLKSPKDGDYPGIDELGLYALDVLTGKIVWKAALPPYCKSARCLGYYNAPVVTGDMVVVESNDGYTRFHNKKTGAIVREIDLNGVSVDTVNGEQVTITGMASAGGPVIADGKFFVGATEAFLAFGPGGKR